MSSTLNTDRLNLPESEWCCIHRGQIWDILECISTVTTTTAGVLDTGLQWKLESAIAQLCQVRDTQSVEEMMK